MYNGGPPGACLYRCGANPDIGAAVINKPDALGAQKCLNAAAHRALVGEAVRLLLSSLSAGTQNMYMMRWEMWKCIRQTRALSPWIDTTVRNWGQDVISFPTRGHVATKNVGGAHATRFSAVGFLHLMEGKGDLEGESFRTRSLI